MRRTPKFRRSKNSGPKQAKRKIKVHAKSEETGLVHYFNVDGILELADQYIASHNARLRVDLTKGASFWAQLSSGLRPGDTFVDWSGPVYRIVYGFDPLSVAGSLAAGGRFNVGGPQFVSHKLFPGLSMQPCLYAAESIDCAIAEVGGPTGSPQVFALTPKRPLRLWKMVDVIIQLNIPGLAAEVNATPMAAVWLAQKSPLISQLLSAYLRNLGGDGVIYPSSKHPGSQIMAFFLKDDVESNSTFEKASISLSGVAEA